ncbi:MAG TPA: TIGR03986 family CRISPR-associated RAMP protein [archaeon]|nr:TIGR03986 family CRISPR-associated RAMP protein [archaeon]
MGKKTKFVESDEMFVNPYFFIPLEEKCMKEYKFEGEKGLTGWFECELTPLAPIFIPNTTNVNRFQRSIEGKGIKSYEFYSYQDLSDVKSNNPLPPKSAVIPGSEMRGMIRSAFEALTNSCLSTIDDKRPLYRRVTTPGHPGQIRGSENDWAIHPCQKYTLNKSNYQREINGYAEGDTVHFDADRNKRIVRIRNDEGGIKGYIHHGEYMMGKNYESVFVPDVNKNPININKAILKNYLKNIDLYNQDTVNLLFKSGEHHGYPNIRNLKIKDLNKALVYYLKYNNHIYLGPAHIGREVFFNNLKNIISKKDYTPCNSLDRLCTACKLFGFISGEDQLASRIRFTDAFPDKELSEDDYFEPGYLAELSSPKLSASEFYIKRPKNKENQEADIWNYDYAGRWKKIGRDWKIIPFQDPNTEIRGRKFYWHHKITEPQYITEDLASNRNVYIRPLKQQIKFLFKIFFSNISEIELFKLLWTLEIGSETKNAHKIGMGKPLGLGSVKLLTNQLIIRNLELENDVITYELLDKIEYYKERVRNYENSEDLLGCDKRTLKFFKKITNFDEAPRDISYPLNVGGDYSYEWFMQNKKIRPESTGTKPIIHKSLPDSVDGPQLRKYTSPERGILESSTNEPQTGIVKWFNKEKGFGKISVNNSNIEAFVHHSDIVGEGFKNLIEGQEVEFTLFTDRKGPRAKNVKTINSKSKNHKF